MVDNITSILSSVLNWIATIISALMANEVTRVIILIPLCATLLFVVLGIFKAFFNK